MRQTTPALLIWCVRWGVQMPENSIIQYRRTYNRNQVKLTTTLGLKIYLKKLYDNEIKKKENKVE